MRNKATLGLSILLVVVPAFVFWPYFARVNLPAVHVSALGSGTVRARVTEIIEEGEIVRTLVGSLGLVMAVPLTTTIAILFALRADLLLKWG